MIQKGQLGAAWLVAFITIWLNVPCLWAASPTEQLKTTVNRVLETFSDPELQGNAKRTEKREQLRRIILPRFDFIEMARRSLGNHWQRNPEKQKEFVSAFTDFLEDSYLSKSELYKNGRILYVRERLDKDFAEINTKFVQSSGDETSIDYKLHLVGREWKVYDMLIDNISLVNNYRSQINRILTTAPMDDLLKKLHEKRADSYLTK
ncbi:MAG: MlaC/ttg2D family ABC transporter substrate-binding protein [Candidatus Binatia bacterium]